MTLPGQYYSNVPSLYWLLSLAEQLVLFLHCNIASAVYTGITPTMFTLRVISV